MVKLIYKKHQIFRVRIQIDQRHPLINIPLLHERPGLAALAFFI
jgi:hypothetical protein